MSAVRKTEPKAAGQPNDGGKAVCPALARAVSLHLEGKHKDALKELNTALENGEESAEIYAAKGHLQYELEQYDDAIKILRALADKPTVLVLDNDFAPHVQALRPICPAVRRWVAIDGAAFPLPLPPAHAARVSVRLAVGRAMAVPATRSR